MTKDPIEPGPTKERGLYITKPVQLRVMTHHLDGKSNRQIAIEEGLDRETVRRILTQQELLELVGEQQTRLQLLVSKAISVYEEALDHFLR